MRAVVVLAALVALTGCKSSEEKRAAQAATDEAYCASIGAPTGSPGHTECRLRLTEQQSRERIARQQGGPYTCTTQPLFGNLQTTCY